MPPSRGEQRYPGFPTKNKTGTALIPNKCGRSAGPFLPLRGGKGFFVSKNLEFRSEQLRKISCFVLAVCLLNIGWSWPFSKSRATDNAQRTTKEEQNQPGGNVTPTDSKSEIKSSPRPVVADVTVLEVSRVKDSSADITRSISVINKEEIRNSTALHVPDLLKSKAGIVVSKTEDNPKGMSVDMRGFGEAGKSNVLVLVDGRRTNQIDLSGTDWATIPLSIVERIEIIRGPSSVLYGDNAAGGVINIVTEKTKTGIHAKAETEIGLHKYKRNGGTVSAANDWARGLFHFENTQDGGWRTNTDYWANDWFGKLGVGPFYGAGLDLTAGHHRDRYGMPGALFMDEIESLGRGGSTHSQDRGWSSETFFTADPKWNFELGGNELELSGFNSFRRRQSKGSFVSAWGDWETVHHIDTYEFQPKIKWTKPLTDWLTSKMAGGFDVFFAKDKIRSGNRAPGQDYTEISKKSLGVYVLENLTFWDKLLLNLGFRGSWAKYRFDQKEVLTNLDTASMRNAAFDIGIGYHYQDRSLVYFDISRSFRTPTTEECYQNTYISWLGPVAGGLNAGLKQQQQMNYELGVRDNTFKPLSVSTNVFLTDIKDELYYDPITFANSNYSSLTRRYGLEMESSLKLFEKRWFNIKPFFNLTTQKPYFKGGDYANKSIPFVPSFKYSTGFVMEPVKGLTVSTELNHLGHCFAISDPTNDAAKLKSYTTVDLKVRYNWRWATVWASLTNLFDVRYSEYGGYSSGKGQVGYYPAQGRGFVSGFSLEY